MIVRDPWFPEVHPRLKALLDEEDLELAGVAEVDDSSPAPVEAQMKQWLEAGNHGTMQWMERHAELKYRPSRILPGTRSIIFVALNYYQKTAPPARADTDSEAEGRIARYAWGRDYHKELGKRIKRIARRLGEQFPGEEFRAWTDATPLAERYFGEQAGIGFSGRNTLLINGQYGSWFVIGEILSTVRFDPSGPVGERHGACPSSCRKCIDVCPTGALVGPNQIDARRCISYLTIEHVGIIPEPLRPQMGSWIFGCDLCQEVCPLNVRAQITTVEGFRKPIAGERRSLREILRIRDHQEFCAFFAGSPVMRAGRSRMVRNASIAAANLGARECIEDLRVCADDKDEVIAIHAQWALNRLEHNDE